MVEIPRILTGTSSLAVSYSYNYQELSESEDPEPETWKQLDKTYGRTSSCTPGAGRTQWPHSKSNLSHCSGALPIDERGHVGVGRTCSTHDDCIGTNPTRYLSEPS